MSIQEFANTATNTAASAPNEAVLPPMSQSQQHPEAQDEFLPLQPESLEESSLEENDVSRLVLKFLYVRGVNTGRQVAKQIKLPFSIVEPILLSLRNQQLIGYRGSSMGGDYQYELSPKGIEKARQHMDQCTFCGSAPVSLKEYYQSVSKQSLRNLSPKFSDVKHVLDDMVLEPILVSQVGQALTSSSCIFLHGAPGNGKSSIARRLVSAVSPYIWIPRTIVIGGEIIRFYDNTVHQEAPLPESNDILDDMQIDERWVRIQRPTIVVGGELTLSQLDATLNNVTGIIEAPIHMKANCGCLVVDDFGRQRVRPIELLNRWIVPLETKHDYLCLPSGRQIEVPFDQLLIFATNLSPKNIVDEAFLRRIPYKVRVFDPSEDQFRELFQKRCTIFGIIHDEEWVEYLLETQYRKPGRALRFSHVDDLLQQIRDFCDFHGQPLVMNKQTMDMAINNFFSLT